MKSVLEKFKACKIEVDLRDISPNLRLAIADIVCAIDGVDRIFLKQQDEALPNLYDSVMRGDDEIKKEFFRAFKGPWSTVDEHRSSVPGVPDRLPGCSFYPSNMSKDEWEKFTATIEGSERDKFLDSYTVIRRSTAGLSAIPYHEYYAKELVPVTKALRSAAAHLDDEKLAAFLRLQAEGLENGDYLRSYSDWVKQSFPIEIVIGPHEVYADGIGGIKAAYEAMLFVVDQEKGRQLATIGESITEFSRQFPCPSGARPSVGGLAPIVIANQIYSSGEASAGIPVAAFNLPNDASVRRDVGWKQVMIYNIMQAKFNNCTKPIIGRLLGKDADIDFEPYFYKVLFHEVSHGLGPTYRKNGESAARCMGPFYAPIEEAKAEAGATFLAQRFGGKYGIPISSDEEMLKGVVALFFRSMRSAPKGAHGTAAIVRFNWLKERGILDFKTDNSFSIDHRKFREANDDFLNRLTELQALATIEECEEFIEKYNEVPSQMDAILRTLEDIPLDIRPIWPNAV